MRALITGAGQIGTQVARELATTGNEAVVLRRGDGGTPGAELYRGDAGDRAALRAAAKGTDAIFHCIHTAYSTEAWKRDLPSRDAAAMDVAAELGIPVIFPESVYAYGHGAVNLGEDTLLSPASPLGQVRADLLRARAIHPASTASVVASDLIGPTASAQGSVILTTILTPAATGRRVRVLGDPDAPHAVTYIPDLARGMIAAVPLASQGDTTLLAPTAEAISQRRIAEDAASATGRDLVGVSRIPNSLLALGAPFSPTAREIFRQRYLWSAPSVLRPGRLTTEFGINPTPWQDVLGEWAASVRSSR